MTEKLTTSDPAAAWVDDTEIAFFLADALETGKALIDRNLCSVIVGP